MMDDIAAFRDFNRFHTRLAGALNEHLLQSEFTLPQARVLYEVAVAPADQPLAASDLAGILRVDPGYLSRLVGGLQGMGLIARAPGGNRRQTLSLTAAGHAAFARLDAASAAEVAALLAPLAPADRRALIGAMDRIRRILGREVPRVITLRDPAPGDFGQVIRGQARLYAEEYGWDWTFEGMVAGIVGDFVKGFDPARERAWIAEAEGEIIGSVFVVKQDEATARLRLLYVDARARGLGLGRRLVEAAIGFAGAKGYRRIELWTNDILHAARRIYETAGFTLIEEERHHSFGKDLVGQTWALDLIAGPDR